MSLLPNLATNLNHPIPKRQLYETYFPPFNYEWDQLRPNLESYATEELELPEIDIVGEGCDDARRSFPAATLGESEKAILREFLRSVSELHVECGEINAYNWRLNQKAEFAAILRTFPNISDMNYSDCDKNGDMFLNECKDIWYRWGVRSERIIRYHGSDDWCYKGLWSSHARFLQVCQEAFQGTWKELHHPEFQDVLQAMNFCNDVELTNELLEDMAYFRNLVCVNRGKEPISYTIPLSGFDSTNEKTFRLPPIMNISLEPVLDKENPIDRDKQYIIHFIVELSPNLLHGPYINNAFPNVEIKIQHEIDLSPL